MSRVVLRAAPKSGTPVSDHIDVAEHATEPQLSRADSLYAGYVLFVLACVSFFNYLDRALWSVLAVPVKAELQLSDTQLGLLGGFAFALFYATMGLPIARMADTRQRVKILSVAAALWSIATAACGLAHSFITMFLARVGMGVGEAGCLPPSHSLLADYFARERRAFALGLFETGGAIGVMGGIMLAGFLADRVGWRLAFVILGMPGILVALLVRFTVQEPPRGRLDVLRPAARAGSGSVAALLRRPTYRRLIVAFSLCVFGYFGILQWLPNFLARSHGLSTTEIGLALGLAFGAGSILGTSAGALVAPHLIRRDRHWELRLPAIAFALGGPVFLLVFQLPSAHLSIAATFFATLIVSIGFAPLLAAIQSVAEPHVRATAVAIIMFTSALVGQGGGPAIVGLLSDAFAGSRGQESLRLALSLVTFATVAAGAQLWIASRTMEADLVS